ncbi:hypothetical protein ACWZHB_33075 [Nocardia sp. FBN12]|uniref:hypothetical protein n=1 Tax=Nocardia sp. FBN12 TaxID=3419766 RepID=UPI003D078028
MTGELGEDAGSPEGGLLGVSVVGLVDTGLLVGVDVSVPLAADAGGSPWVGIAVDPVPFGICGVVSPVDGVSVGVLVFGLAGEESPG